MIYLSSSGFRLLTKPSFDYYIIYIMQFRQIKIIDCLT